MEIVECGLEDEDSYVSVPRGGPIYVPDFVGPITRVPEFLTSVVQHLQVNNSILMISVIYTVKYWISHWHIRQNHALQDLEAEISQARDEVLS